MNGNLFHTYRNTPLGREIFLQSLYFCKTLDLSLNIYVPESKRFFMQFDNDTIPVDLDRSYRAYSATAFSHSKELVQRCKVKSKWITPDSYPKSTQPCIQKAFDFMCCPRNMQQGSVKIRLGHIGSKVRRIISAAPFPVLLSSPVYKPWKRIAVFYEVASASADVLQLGLKLAQVTKFPLDVFTPQQSDGDKHLKSVAHSGGSPKAAEKSSFTCHQYDPRHFTENLYEVSPEALVIVKCSTKGVIRAQASTMEMIQSTVPNNLLIVGPKYQPRFGLADVLEQFNRTKRNHRVAATTH